MICPSCGYENFARDATNCDLCHAPLHPTAGDAVKSTPSSEDAAEPQDALLRDAVAVAEGGDEAPAARAKPSSRPRPTPAAARPKAAASAGAGPLLRLGAPLVGLALLAGVGYLLYLGFQVPAEGFSGHEGVVHHVGTAHEGARIVTAGQDGAVVVWSAGTGDLLQRFPGAHAGGATWAAFLPDGGILSAGRDAALREWDPESGEARRSLEIPHEQGVATAALSPAGDRILYATEALGTLVLRALEGDAAGEELDAEGVNGVAFSPDGSLAACGTSRGEVLLFSVPDGAFVASLEGHERSVEDVAFSRDGSQVATASHDMTVRVWDVETGELVGSPLVSPNRRGVSALAYSPDGAYLVAASVDGLVSIYHGGSRRLAARRRLGAVGQPPAALAFLPERQAFLLASGRRFDLYSIPAIVGD